jgi:site-specific DNA-cytosine methylase
MSSPLKVVRALDRDPWACRAYRAALPGVEVIEAAASTFPTYLRPGLADILIASPPTACYTKEELDLMPDVGEAIFRVRPRMFLIETDPLAFTCDNGKYISAWTGHLWDGGYFVHGGMTYDAWFGVPVIRERAWIWGVRTDLKDRVQFPNPTHKPPTVKEQLFMFPCDMPTFTTWQGETLKALAPLRKSVMELMGIQGYPLEPAADASVEVQRRLLASCTPPPVAQAFAAALRKADPISETVVDLFCGIGGMSLGIMEAQYAQA